MCAGLCHGCDRIAAVAADLMHTLWEADVVVFKAHITTGPGGKVLDMFWIYDNRCELPENHRCAHGHAEPLFGHDFLHSLPIMIIMLTGGGGF